MSFQWKDVGGGLRSAGAISLRVADGTDPADLRAVDRLRVRVANGTNPADLREGYKQGIRLAASPTEANGSTTAKTGPVYTNSVTVNVAGGTPPYTHDWGVSSPISIIGSIASPTVYFSANPPVNSEITGTAADFVTDANGLTALINVPVSISRDSF